MKTYTFKVVAEPDEDGWFAHCPVLERHGAATWGYTEAEALKNIEQVVHMVVESMLEHGEQIPEETSDDVQVTVQPHVAVTV